MADIVGSESQYANQRSGTSANKASSASQNLFGNTVVTPPISSALQNLTPGSREWINARMATIIEQLRQQYSDSAARRGMLQSGDAEKQFEEAVAQKQAEVESEAAQYNASALEAQKDRDLQEKLAKESAKSQETAAMYSGLGSMAPYLLFGKMGSGDSYSQKMVTDPVTGNVTAAKDASGNTVYQKNTTSSPIKSAWNYLTKDNTSLGTGLAGTGVGTLLSGDKNKTASTLSGLGATGLGQLTGNSGNWSNLIGSGLASSMLTNKTLSKPFSSKNIWKTLAGGLGLATSAGAFGSF